MNLETYSISHKIASWLNIAVVFVVPGHCASEILLARIIGELYAQVSLFLQCILRWVILQLLLLLVPNGQYNSIALEVYVHCKIGECMNDRITLECCM